MSSTPDRQALFAEQVLKTNFGTCRSRGNHVQFFPPDADTPVPGEIQKQLTICSNACKKCQRCCKTFSTGNPINMVDWAGTLPENQKKAILDNFVWLGMVPMAGPFSNSWFYTCKALTPEGCSVYADRPSICRSFYCRSSFYGKEMPVEGSLFGSLKDSRVWTNMLPIEEAAKVIKDNALFSGQGSIDRIDLHKSMSDLPPVLQLAVIHGVLYNTRDMSKEREKEVQQGITKLRSGKTWKKGTTIGSLWKL